MYYFYTNMLKPIFSKKPNLERTNTCFKTGFPVLIMLLLYFTPQSSLWAQEISVNPPSIEYNLDSSAVDDNNDIALDTLGGNHDTMMVFPLPPQDTIQSKKLFYFALKNNLLYDAVLLPNLTAEVYLGKQFSLAIEGNWSWWALNKSIKSDWFHRIQSVGAEFRYWINSPSPFQGHAVGIYSMVGDYDIRLFTENEDSKGWLSYGSWSTGLSYAYNMPIAKRINLEFGFAVGYLGGKYYEYNYCMTHERWEQQAKYNRNYFGPTRVGVSVVWLLGNGNNTRNRGVNSTRGK